MAETVALQVVDDAGGWRTVAVVSPDGPPGSLSSKEPTGREVYVFGWLEGGAGPGLWRSQKGVDVEVGAGRWITTKSFDLIAPIAETLVWLIVTGDGAPVQVRFVLEDGAGG